MWPQAKDHPALSRPQEPNPEGSSPTAFEGSTPCRHLDPRLGAPRAVRPHIPAVPHPLVCGALSPQP